LRIKLLASTPDVEVLVAAAALTTSSRREPSEIFRDLRARKEKVEKILAGLMLKHGSVLEHNRLVFLAEADEGEVLDLLLASKFFEVSRLGRCKWLLSCNLRTIIELLASERGLPDGVREAFSGCLKEVAPALWRKVVGHEG